jgi:hypothetical protein
MRVVCPPRVFEASHTDRCSAEAADVWALWADLDRWPDWNEQIERVEIDGELQAGAEARVKFRRGGTVKFEVIELEPERVFLDEARFPGARLGHEHRLKAISSGCEITHRIYVEGALSGFWALMLGRKRMRESVARFVERERELTEPKAAASRSSSGTGRSRSRRKRRR